MKLNVTNQTAPGKGHEVLGNAARSFEKGGAGFNVFFTNTMTKL
jgi:aspartate/glutamate racemase